MQTRQQQDARLAHDHVIKVQKEEIQKDYARAVYRFPILVRTNGLQQTIGFYAGKASSEGAGKGEKIFLRHSAEVLGLEDDSDDLPSKIFDLDLEQYLLHTRRCLEASIWYRRFVESMLKIDQTGEQIKDSRETGKEDGDVNTDAE